MGSGKTHFVPEDFKDLNIIMLCYLCHTANLPILFDTSTQMDARRVRLHNQVF